MAAPTRIRALILPATDRCVLGKVSVSLWTDSSGELKTQTVPLMSEQHRAPEPWELGGHLLRGTALQPREEPGAAVGGFLRPGRAGQCRGGGGR